MKITYQGRETETVEKTVRGFLSGRSVDLSKSLVEYCGEVYAVGADLDVPLREGAELNVFHIVAGG